MLIMLLFEFLIPTTRIIRVIIAGLSALVGGLIGNKLFPNKEWKNYVPFFSTYIYKEMVMFPK